MDDCVNVEIFKRYTPSEYKLINITQLTFTCSKSTIETVEILSWLFGHIEKTACLER